MPAAVAYHRVSTRDQDPTLARGELEAAARQRGYDPVFYVEETGSGARNDRPGLQRVLAMAARGQVGAVLVWKLDRFGRSALDVQTNITALRSAGVRFIATSQMLDVGPEGSAIANLQVSMLAAFAEFERELISERTMLGLAKARRSGVRFGRPAATPAPSGIAVARLVEEGRSMAEVAETLGCSTSQARHALKKHAQAVGPSPAHHRNPPGGEGGSQTR